MKIQVLKDGPVVEVDVANAFCPTGKGGGVDPSCGGEKGGGGGRTERFTSDEKKKLAELESRNSNAINGKGKPLTESEKALRLKLSRQKSDALNYGNSLEFNPGKAVPED